MRGKKGKGEQRPAVRIYPENEIQAPRMQNNIVFSILWLTFLFLFIFLSYQVQFITERSEAEGRAAAAFHHSLSPFSLPLFSFPRSSSHPLATKDV